LVLQRLGGQPIVHRDLAAPEGPARVVPTERFESEAVRKPDRVHDAPRMAAPSRRCASVNLGGALKACQNASCSSGVSARTCSAAPWTSLLACATVTART